MVPWSHTIRFGSATYYPQVDISRMYSTSLHPLTSESGILSLSVHCGCCQQELDNRLLLLEFQIAEVRGTLTTASRAVNRPDDHHNQSLSENLLLRRFAILSVANDVVKISIIIISTQIPLQDSTRDSDRKEASRRHTTKDANVNCTGLKKGTSKSGSTHIK